MASPTLTPKRSETTEAHAFGVTSLEAFGLDIERRREALAEPVVMPRNEGTRRTPQKRTLLAAIAATGTRW